ncbi:hypothetical protein [Anaerovorax sp. IOR16]|uniref:hypothetical protein n=1 Tax=Anaerovorax sp. IOR16 TaxID=2773458 RepID=UPI0019CFCE4D|nr:hypothetical protein [Anaerovorax sp. IOR16]
MNIKFETGTIELAIQGDPNKILRFNPTDENVVSKFLNLVTTANQKLEELSSECDKILSSEKKKMEKVKLKNKLNLELDALLRNELDTTFGVGVSDMAFGDMCVTAITESGNCIFVNFLMALTPIIESENKKRSQKVDDIIKKYKPQVK